MIDNGKMPLMSVTVPEECYLGEFILGDLGKFVSLLRL